MSNINPNEPKSALSKNLDLPLLSKIPSDNPGIEMKRRPSGFVVADERTLKKRPSTRDALGTITVQGKTHTPLSERFSRFYAAFKEIMTAPLYALLFSLIVGLFPSLKVTQLLRTFSHIV